MLKVLFECCNRSIFNQETLQITKNGRYFGIACPRKKREKNPYYRNKVVTGKSISYSSFSLTY